MSNQGKVNVDELQSGDGEDHPGEAETSAAAGVCVSQDGKKNKRRNSIHSQLCPNSEN